MGRRSGAQNLKSQEPPSELRPPSSASAPSAARRIGGWSLPALSSMPVVLRSVFAAFQNPPLPHHGHKRAVFALLFAAFLLLSGGNAPRTGHAGLGCAGARCARQHRDGRDVLVYCDGDQPRRWAVGGYHGAVPTLDGCDDHGIRHGGRDGRS